MQCTVSGVVVYVVLGVDVHWRLCEDAAWTSGRRHMSAV